MVNTIMEAEEIVRHTFDEYAAEMQQGKVDPSDKGQIIDNYNSYFGRKAFGGSGRTYSKCKVVSFPTNK